MSDITISVNPLSGVSRLPKLKSHDHACHDYVYSLRTAAVNILSTGRTSFYFKILLPLSCLIHRYLFTQLRDEVSLSQPFRPNHPVPRQIQPKSSSCAEAPRDSPVARQDVISQTSSHDSSTRTYPLSVTDGGMLGRLLWPRAAASALSHIIWVQKPVSRAETVKNFDLRHRSNFHNRIYSRESLAPTLAYPVIRVRDVCAVIGQTQGKIAVIKLCFSRVSVVLCFLSRS